MPLIIKYEFICSLNFLNFKLKLLCFIHFSSNLAVIDKLCFTYAFMRLPCSTHDQRSAHLDTP